MSNDSVLTAVQQYGGSFSSVDCCHRLQCDNCNNVRLGAHWQLLVVQLFSCPDGEHCFIRERAHWQLFVAATEKLLPDAA
jgi:hypothetical protein